GFGSASTLTKSDADALGSKVVAPDIAAIAVTTSTSGSLTAGSTNWTTSVVGTTPSWLRVRARKVDVGRFLTAADERNARAVTVLAATTAQELFVASDAALGQTVTFNGVPLQVVGVLTASGSSSGTNDDDMAIVPYSTATERLIGGTDRTSV